MSPRAELIKAVFEVVQAYRLGSRGDLNKCVRQLVEIWEKHPRRELREMMKDDTTESDNGS